MRTFAINALLISGFSLCVSACQPSAKDVAFVQGVQKREADRTSAHTEGLKAVIAFLNESSGNCETTDVLNAQMAIATLSSQESYYHSMQIWGFLTETQKRKWAIQFALAQAALTQKCLDLADGIYRDIIQTYTGSAYAGIRERARVGLDDVRDARRKS